MAALDKTTEQYKVALKYVNTILRHCERQEISDLTEFTKVKRADILKKEIIDELTNGLADELFVHYNKAKLGFYRKYAPTYPLCVLKGILKTLGLKLEQKTLSTPLVNEGVTYFRTCI